MHADAAAPFCTVKGKIMKRKKKVILGIVLSLLFVYLAAGFTVGGNRALEMSRYEIYSERLPEEFDGLRIVQISDLHNTEMGEGNEKLLEMIRQAQPDIIAITGDLIDGYKTDTAVALDFVREAMKTAPCYYVTGNHEAWTEEYDSFREKLLQEGVRVLDDEQIYIERLGQRISLIGLSDPAFSGGQNGYGSDMTAERLDGFEYGDFTLLLAHRPELFEVYAERNIDLVLSGHTHAGQFRFPFIGGIFAPDQGLFPKYCEGLHTRDNTDMIISRGIGNSIIPLRFYNRPEAVLIELRCES